MLSIADYHRFALSDVVARCGRQRQRFCLYGACLDRLSSLRELRTSVSNREGQSVF